MAARLNKLIGEAIFQDIIGCFPILAQRQQIKLWEARWVGKPIAKRVEWGTVFHQWTIFKKFWIGQSRGSNRSRLSAFVQISAPFQIYITDMSRHLHHLTKCPFEVKKGLKGLFLHWEVIANKQTLPYFVLPSGLRLLCRHWGFCADFCTKKCSVEALLWSLIQIIGRE